MSTTMPKTAHADAQRQPQRPRGRPRRTLPFEQARDLVRRLQLPSASAYAAARSADPELRRQLPANPSVSYARSGWQSWADFLGLDTADRGHLSYRQACALVRRLQLQTSTDYELWIHSAEADPAMPRAPNRRYAAQWRGWNAFLKPVVKPQLGRRQVYYTLPAARACVRRLKIRTAAQYRDMLLAGRLPKGLPPVPSQYYGAEFRSWQDFLGSRAAGEDQEVQMQGEWLAFDAARTLVSHLRILTLAQWTRFAASPMRPAYLPKEPWIAYANAGFRTMEEFLAPAVAVGAPAPRGKHRAASAGAGGVPEAGARCSARGRPAARALGS
jgi:hypothetical protein